LLLRDEVYGNCTQLREYFESEDQAYVLRVPCNFRITMRSGTVLTCAEAVAALLRHPRRREIRSAGRGSKGDRWYAWAWLGTASPRTTCSSGGTSAPVSWPSATATCPRASCAPRPG